MKNDERDATDLVDLLRLGRLAEAWVAPPPLRELRELIRYRGKLVHLRSNFKSQVHAILAKERVTVPMSDLFGVGGQVLLDKVHLADAYRVRVESLRHLIESVNREIAMLEEQSDPYFAGDLGYHAVQAIPGVGPVLAATFVAEIGQISRFTSARHLCSWAGLTPTHKESDVTVRRGHITKQGSRLVRWAPSRPWPTSVPIRPSDATTATSGIAGAPRSAAWPRRANFLSSSGTACATARSVAWPRWGEKREGRNRVRARLESWSPHSGETEVLIEPTGLRPNHSMSLPRDEQKSGTTISRTRSRAWSTAIDALAIGLTASTSSSASQPKNALTIPQCVSIVRGASPAPSIASITPPRSRSVTTCGNIGPMVGAHHFDQHARSRAAVDSAPPRFLFTLIID